MKCKIVILLKNATKEWLDEVIRNNLGLTVVILSKNYILVELEMAYGHGNEEIYFIPRCLDFIPRCLEGNGEVLVNTWEYGCNGKAVVISDLDGNMMKPLRLKKNGMAMFSTAKGFISVTAIGNRRVEIIKHTLLVEKELMMISYKEEVIYKGKWFRNVKNQYLKYDAAVKAAKERSQMKQNPDFPLFALTLGYFN